MKRVVVVVLGVAVLAACVVPSGFRQIDPSYTGVLITAGANANEQYDLTARSGSPLSQVNLSAGATVTSDSLRTSFYPTGQVPAESGQVCATWAGPSAPTDLVQQGLAARVETNATGPRRAITVTKNIWVGVVWVLNVNLWTLYPDASLDTLGGIGMDFSSVLLTGAVVRPFPWRVCARVAGSIVATDVATGSNPPVPFSDASHVKTVTLPSGWDYRGQFGWYIGHLPAGTTFTYQNLSAIAPLLAATARSGSATVSSPTTTPSPTTTSSTTATSSTITTPSTTPSATTTTTATRP